MEEKTQVGEITHYFDKIGVAIVRLSGRLKIGDVISIEGNSTNFQQKVSSIQIEHINVDEAGAGEDIGLKVEQKVREGDKVFKAL
ncbi:MAG: translation elongation factor-like protein [Candidatus Micrarchaeia archaeon]